MRSSLFVALSALLLVGCSTTRTFTISARPADAKISIDSVERGQGTVTAPVVFKDKKDTHTVAVSRLGFKDQEISLTRDFPRDQIEVELRPRTRKVTFTVSPAPAVIKVDGRPLSGEAVSSASPELEFTVDAQDKWIAHKVVAERPNYKPAEISVSWTDNKQTYPIKLEPLTKNIAVTSEPTSLSLM